MADIAIEINQNNLKEQRRNLNVKIKYEIFWRSLYAFLSVFATTCFLQA